MYDELPDRDFGIVVTAGKAATPEPGLTRSRSRSSTSGSARSGGPIIDPNDPIFLAPGGMESRIVELCRRTHQPPPTTRPAVVRCILDSLAAAFARTVEALGQLSGRPARRIHLVGGGSRNALLCQLTANATGLPVIAGPAEATAIGNALVQARAIGLVEGDLMTLRAIVRATQPLAAYEPRARSGPA